MKTKKTYFLQQCKVQLWNSFAKTQRDLNTYMLPKSDRTYSGKKCPLRDYLQNHPGSCWRPRAAGCWGVLGLPLLYMFSVGRCWRQHLSKQTFALPAYSSMLLYHMHSVPTAHMRAMASEGALLKQCHPPNALPWPAAVAGQALHLDNHCIWSPRIEETISKSCDTKPFRKPDICVVWLRLCLLTKYSCVISFTYIGHVRAEFVRLHQAFKHEPIWKTKPWFSYILYTLFSKRKKHFCSADTAVYEALQWGQDSKCPQCAEDNLWLEDPQSGVYDRSAPLSVIVSLDSST